MTTRSRRSRLDRRAAAVRQYSVVVRLMKVVLPLGALLLVVLIFLAGRDRETVADAESAATAAALGAGMRLENPRFAGVTEGGEPFVVTATSALPDGMSPDKIELETPRGEIRLSAERTLTVAADAGTIFQKSERLTLDGSVVLETTDGYRATTNAVELDLEARRAHAPGPIHAQGPRGEIEADALTVIDGSDNGAAVVLHFDGNVRVRYTPPD